MGVDLTFVFQQALAGENHGYGHIDSFRHYPFQAAIGKLPSAPLPFPEKHDFDGGCADDMPVEDCLIDHANRELRYVTPEVFRKAKLSQKDFGPLNSAILLLCENLPDDFRVILVWC